MRELLTVKPLPVRNHEKKETALPVFEEEVLAAEPSRTRGNLSPFRYRHDRGMNKTREWNPLTPGTGPVVVFLSSASVMRRHLPRVSQPVPKACRPPCRMPAVQFLLPEW